MSDEIVNGGVIWLASYPKSGNTWMRFILSHLIKGDITSSADVDSLIPEAAYIPGYQIKIPEKKIVILKTHWGMDESLPMMKHTKGFIYLVRNPLDVMISLHHFNQHRYKKMSVRLTKQEQAVSRRRYIEAFMQHKGNPLVGSGGGNTTWVESVESWLNAANEYPHVIIRYEDMLSDPENEIRRVAKFLKLDISADKVNEISRKTSFKAMKKLEEKEIRAERKGFFYHDNLKSSYQAGSRFMRSGRSGDGKQYMNKTGLEQFDHIFGGVMEMVGYHLIKNTGIVKLRNHDFGEISPISNYPCISAPQVIIRN